MSSQDLLGHQLVAGAGRTPAVGGSGVAATAPAAVRARAVHRPASFVTCHTKVRLTSLAEEHIMPTMTRTR